MMVQVVIRMPWRPMYLASALDGAGDIRSFVRIPRNTPRSKLLSISEFSRRGLIVTEVPSLSIPGFMETPMSACSAMASGCCGSLSSSVAGKMEIRFRRYLGNGSPSVQYCRSAIYESRVAPVR